MDKNKIMTEKLKNDRKLLEDIQQGIPLPPLETEKHRYVRSLRSKLKIDKFGTKHILACEISSSNLLMAIITYPFYLLYRIVLVLMKFISWIYRKLRRKEETVVPLRKEQLGTRQHPLYRRSTRM